MKQRIINILNDHRERFTTSGREILSNHIDSYQIEHIADKIVELYETQHNCKTAGKIKVVLIDKSRKIC